MGNLSVNFDNKSKKNAMIVRLKGEFSGEDVMEAHDKFIDAIRANGNKDFVLDFGDVSYIDSAAIGLIFEMAQIASDADAAIMILNSSNEVKKVLKVTRVDELVQVR